MNLEQLSKYQKLLLSLILDALGYATFILPGIGEMGDVVWAPLSALLMTKMYKGKTGKIAAAVAFIEEAMPGLDVIPTFTLMWLYSYVFKSKNEQTIIDID